MAITLTKYFTSIDPDNSLEPSDPHPYSQLVLDDHGQLIGSGIMRNTTDSGRSTVRNGQWEMIETVDGSKVSVFTSFAFAKTDEFTILKNTIKTSRELAGVENVGVITAGLHSYTGDGIASSSDPQFSANGKKGAIHLFTDKDGSLVAKKISLSQLPDPSPNRNISEVIGHELSQLEIENNPQHQQQVELIRQAISADEPIYDSVARLSVDDSGSSVSTMIKIGFSQNLSAAQSIDGATGPEGLPVPVDVKESVMAKCILSEVMRHERISHSPRHRDACQALESLDIAPVME